MSTDERGRRLRDAIALIALFLAAVAFTYWRDPGVYKLPNAAYEDGRDFFAYYYNHPEPGSILRSYSGYISLISNVVGFSSVRLPVQQVPFALALFPLLMLGLGCSWLALSANRPIVGNDRYRYLACLVLAVAPLGNVQFVSSTAYSIWILLFLLILLSLIDPPKTVGRASVRGAIVAVLICNHPLSIALVPVYLWLGWVHRARGVVVRGYYAALALVAVLYQLFGVEHAEERVMDVLGIARVTATFVLERVVFNTLFSDRLSRMAHHRGHEDWIYLAAGAVVLALAALVTLCRRRVDAGHAQVLAILSYLIVALTALYVFGRSASLDVLTGHPGYRYFWVQRLCFIVLLFVLADAVLAGRRGVRAKAVTAALLAVLAVQLYWLHGLDRGKYWGRPGMGHKVAAFTAEVARQEATGDGSVRARMPRRKWSFELRRPAVRPAE